MDRAPDAAWPGQFCCPCCHAPFSAVASDVEQTAQCPACAAVISIPATEHDAARSGDAEERRLAARKIEQIVTARRAADRSHSYCIVGAVACCVGAIDLTYFALQLVFRDHAVLWPIVYVLLAAPLGGLSWRLARWARALRGRERQAASPPLAPPDFSTLGDGSQMARNLHSLSGQDESGAE